MTMASGVSPLFISVDGIRWLGFDGLLIAATVAVIWMTWHARQRERDVVAPGARIGVGGLSVRGVGGGTASVALTVVGIGLVLLGAFSMVNAESAGAPLLFIIAGGVLAAPSLASSLAELAPTVTRSDQPPAGRSALFIVPALLTVAVWATTSNREQTDRQSDVVLLWIAAMAAFVISVGVHWRPDWKAAGVQVRERRWELAALLAILIAAAAARLWDLSQYPWTMSGDEGIFANFGVDATNGALGNPFGTGWFSNPAMFFYLDGLSIDLFGNAVSGVRVVSALLGVASVLCVYGYVRGVWGAGAGLAAAALTAAFHFHLFYSRIALNNIGDALFWPLTLLLLERGLLGRRRLESALAGLAMGLAVYVVFAHRLLPILALLLLAYALIAQVVSRRSGLGAAIKELAPLAVLTAAGYVIAAAPYLAFARAFPDQVSARSRDLSIFASGWLAAEQEMRGVSAVSVIWEQFKEVALIPVFGVIHGDYRPLQPFVGSAMAAPLVLGLLVVTVFAWRRNHASLAIAYWLGVVAVSFTVGPVQSNRIAMMAALFPIVAALAIESVRRWIGGFGKVFQVVAVGFAVLAVVGIGAANLRFTFAAPNEPDRYSDGNTQVANFLGYELREIGPGVTYYFFAPPRMTVTSHANLAFIAPDAVGFDVNEEWTFATPPPEISGTTLFVFLPERLEEMQVVMNWFPNAESHITYGTYGEELYYVVRVESDQSGVG